MEIMRGILSMATILIVLFVVIIIAVFVACVFFVAYKWQQTRKHIEKEEARHKAEEEAQRQAEEAKRKAEEEALLQAEEAKRKAEEEARLKAEEEARRKAEEEAQRQAEEAKRKAEEETQRQAEEEARRNAEEEARLQAEEEAKRNAEEEARLQAEEEARRKAEEEARLKAKEEARRKADEEARLKAEEEAKRKEDEEAELKAKEEAELKAKEEAELKAKEEAELKAKEETELKAKEEAELKAKEEAELKAKEEEARLLEELIARLNIAYEEALRQTKLTAHKRTPNGYGGRSRESGEKDDQEKKEVLQKALREKTLILRPELVCWKAARKWFIGIELPAEYHEYVGIVVTQNDIPLDQDDRGRWILTQPSGIIQVSWDVSEYPTDIRLDKPYLVFRITGQRENQGCFVQYATFGSYLVLVPDQWHRDEEISGPAIYSPESISITGYQAHYFLLEQGSDNKIGFRTSTNELVIVPIHASLFEFIGFLLPDGHESIGPLFTESPPRIKAVDQNTWISIKTIVVGQEGAGRRRWRTHFAPEPDKVEQFFPAELNHRRGGWYFVRFYDYGDSFVESMDFRFTAALKEIIVTSHSSLPGPEGYLPIPVEFIHDSSCTIHLAEEERNEDILQVQHMGTKTIAVIPPDPVWDRTRWSIVDNDNKVLTETVILIQRVWWAIGDDDFAKVQPRLSDKPLVLPRESFSATSKQFLWLRFPKERWIATVLLGFSKERPRTYRVEVTKRRISIPLCDFEGSQELEEQFTEHSLNLWILFKGQTLQQVTVIQVPPKMPLSPANDKHLLDVRPVPEEIVTKSHLPKTRDFLGLPVDRKCCSTCTFATINDIGIRCIVGTWEERIDKATFCDLFADHSCSRWFGEYTNSSGIIVSK
jgi:membrane protein involved in colicin uptake